MKSGGWFGQTSESVALGPMERSKSLRIEVYPGLSVAGQVVVDTGEPCPKGEVDLRGTSAVDRQSEKIGINGRVAFQTVLPGRGMCESGGARQSK